MWSNTCKVYVVKRRHCRLELHEWQSRRGKSIIISRSQWNMLKCFRKLPHSIPAYRFLAVEHSLNRTGSSHSSHSEYFVLLTTNPPTRTPDTVILPYLLSTTSLPHLLSSPPGGIQGTTTSINSDTLPILGHTSSISSVYLSVYIRRVVPSFASCWSIALHYLLPYHPSYT